MGQLVPEIRSIGAVVAAIAVSATFSQMAFAEELGIDFPLLSDWSGEVSRSYGVEYRTWKGHAGVAKRSVFVVDSAHRIRYRWVTDDALIEPDFSEPMAVLTSLAAAPPPEHAL